MKCEGCEHSLVRKHMDVYEVTERYCLLDGLRIGKVLTQCSGYVGVGEDLKGFDRWSHGGISVKAPRLPEEMYRAEDRLLSGVSFLNTEQEVNNEQKVEKGNELIKKKKGWPLGKSRRKQ